ncbi:hypothetical protein E8E14_000795 [Neopestalotiopsis sp. 37M]|nr:hypothetical protein E8E14_000795 [Neopestalotiopsis sp. 37M]
MSMTSAIPKVKRKFPRRLNHAQAVAESEADLKSGVPTLGPLDKWKPSILKRHSRHQRDKKLDSLVTANPHGGTTGIVGRSKQSPQIGTEEPREPQRPLPERALQLTLSRSTHVETSRLRNNEGHNSLLPASAGPPSGTGGIMDATGSKEQKATSKLAVPHDVSHVLEPSILETGNQTSEGIQTNDAQGGDDQPAIAIDTGRRNDSEAGQNGLLQDSAGNAALPPNLPQTSSAMTTTSSIGIPSTLTKGKDAVRKSNPLSVGVPQQQSVFSRLMPIRIAERTAQRVLIDSSAADQGRLDKVLEILKSKKDQKELFGKEMPRIMCSLVQVIAGDSSPENYICIRGLASHADITKFHYVMSKYRYKQLYEPLKLCYVTAKINKVGLDEPHIVASSSQNTAASQTNMARSKQITSLSPVIESAEPRLGYHLHYRPLFLDETYTGALFQSLVDGQPWVSTLGGVIEIDDSIYIMACEHAPTSFEPSTNNISLADTLLEEDYKGATFSGTGIQANTEGPLVFATAEFCEGLDVPDEPEVNDTLPSIDEEWKRLGLDGNVVVGLEWCLFPVQGHLMLPNFIEESIEEAGNLYQRKRHYLDQISEPQGGHTARIATNSVTQPSGIVLPNSSFIVGGGTDELIEVCTVLLDNGHSIQKGDSGSWVVDTSEPVHYKVIGTTIATSEDEAYFVRIIDQFHEMEKSLGARESAKLAPSFGALINCANLAFLKDDMKSDYLIDEALSPYVLEQFHNGWFLTGLRSFLAEYGNLEQHGEPREKYSGLNHRTTLRDLLLHYGCELLDSLLDCTDFKKRHANEMSTAHLQTLETLEKVLLQAKTDELKRRQRTAAVKAQSDNHATHTSSSHMIEKRQTAPAGPGHWEPPGRSEHVLWFELHPKYGNVQRQALLSFFVLVVLAEGVASASGVAAAAVTYLVQLKDKDQLADMTMTQYLTLGAVTGPISATVTIVQILLIFSSQTYHWYLFCGSRTLRISPRGWTRMLILMLLLMASAIARTMLPALYVAWRRGLQNDGNVFVAAAVAAAPSLLSTASPSIYWNLAAFYTQGSSNDATTELGPIGENVTEKPTTLKPDTPHGSSPGTEDLAREKKKKPSLDSSLSKIGKAKRYHSDHPTRSTSAGEICRQPVLSFKMFSLIVRGLALAYSAWSFVCLEANVRKARALGLPVVRLPIDANNVFWILLQPHVWKILDRLPFNWSSYPRFVRYSRRGWYVPARAEAHVYLGPIWALVSPISINVHVADPDAIQDIVTRRGDFQRPSAELKILELYGPCISTAKWPDWPRHRKPMAMPFNETIMTSVWDESLRQAQAMLKAWTSRADAGIASYQRDTRSLSLNVLAGAGFGKPYDFRSSAEPVVDEIGEYRDSLQTVLDNIILLLIVPFKVLTMIPGRWARIGQAGISFKQHMVKMLEDETAALSQGKSGSGGILTGFVRAADLYHRENSNDATFQGAKKGLSPKEIYGNLFVINFAGHDTTANTLAFATLLLAAHPKVQAWLAEEIKAVTQDRPIEQCDYRELFPKLNRCRAVVYETLRLYPPVPALPSITCDHRQELQVGEKTYDFPVGINFTANLRATQTHPEYWQMADEWRPSRWILSRPAPTSASPSTPQVEQERFFVPSKNIFFPWGEGPQICPGKRFAEVEAVAVLASVFKEHRLHIKKNEGESDGAAYKRFEKCVNDVDLEMLVRLRDADQVTLICEKA